MTYIKQLSGEDYSKYRIAVLVGQFIKNENCRNIFINGAIEVNEIDASGEIVFSNDDWSEIYEKIKKYFTDAEIVGWFVGGPGYLLEDMDKVTKAHVDNFAGQDKTLLTYDNMEKEEAFFVYENGRLNKQEGYYIYYEKNEEMQNYMIDQKKPPSEEANYDDKVSREIRTVIQNKKPAAEDNKSITRLMYAAGTLLAVIILVVGATMLNNYDQMKNIQKSLSTLSENMQQYESILAKDDSAQPAVSDAQNGEAQGTKENSGSDEDADSKDGSLNVEVVPGNVEPIDDDEQNNAPGEELAGEDKTAEDSANQEDTASGNTPTKAPKTSDNNDKEEPQKQNTDKTEEVKYYTVKEGDSLIGISFKLYNSANYMSKIMELNNIEDEDLIYVGQRLIVP
jgi:LysM repeat protein